MPTIGFLYSQSPDGVADRLRGFRQGLKEAGYSEGDNVTIEYRWAEGHYDRAAELAADLVRRQVAVIVAFNAHSALALGLTPEVIPISRTTIDSHMKQLEESVRKHKGGVVLVVGHEETLTLLIAALGGPRLPDICPKHHANLFSLTMSAGKAHLVHSRYGAPDVVDNAPGLECL